MSEFKNINLFFTDISEKIRLNGNKASVDFELPKNTSINSECFYIFDLLKKEIVYDEGFELVLGMKPDELKGNLLFDHIHQDDRETVFRISQAAINHCFTNPFECTDSLLQMSYRFVKQSGETIRILSQSKIYKMSDEGIPLAAIVKLTDISFLESTLYVTWNFNASNLNLQNFKNQVYGVFKDFFSDREKEIILSMEKGLTNKDIATKLNISEHTVATHRKNILKKANRHNTKDLILFCKRKGII